MAWETQPAKRPDTGLVIVLPRQRRRPSRLPRNGSGATSVESSAHELRSSAVQSRVRSSSRLGRGAGVTVGRQVEAMRDAGPVAPQGLAAVPPPRCRKPGRQQGYAGLDVTATGRSMRRGRSVAGMQGNGQLGVDDQPEAEPESCKASSMLIQPTRGPDPHSPCIDGWISAITALCCQRLKTDPLSPVEN